MGMKDRIMELYLSEHFLSLRYFGVAETLETDPDKTREVLKELLDKKSAVHTARILPAESFIFVEESGNN